jgi:hypothetical protein
MTAGIVSQNWIATIQGLLAPRKRYAHPGRSGWAHRSSGISESFRRPSGSGSCNSRWRRARSSSPHLYQSLGSRLRPTQPESRSASTHETIQTALLLASGTLNTPEFGGGVRGYGAPATEGTISRNGASRVTARSEGSQIFQSIDPQRVATRVPLASGLPIRRCVAAVYSTAAVTDRLSTDARSPHLSPNTLLRSRPN